MYFNIFYIVYGRLSEIEHYITLYIDPIRSGVFETTNDPGGGGVLYNA